MLATDQLFSVSHIAWNLITCRPFTNHLKYFTASQTTFTTDGSSASTIITHSCIPLDCNHQTLCFLQPFSRRCIVLEINKISLFQKKKLLLCFIQLTHIQPGWAYVDGLLVLFPMRCYWLKRSSSTRNS